MRKLLFIFVLLLGGCSTAKFYRFQGFTECAPSVACMASEINGKQCKNASEARKFNTKIKYWRFYDIQQYLASRGIGSELDEIMNDDYLSIFKTRTIMGVHYVIVYNNKVYDPFFGEYDVDNLETFGNKRLKITG